MNHKRSKLLGYVLAFFLGIVGAHLFYYKKYLRGVLYLVFCWTYIPMFLGWIDMFFISKWHSELENGKETSKTVVVKKESVKTVGIAANLNSFANSLAFYNEEDVILPKYSHLQTSKEILQSIKSIKNPKKEKQNHDGYSIEFTHSRSGEDFVRESLKNAQKKESKCTEIPLQAYWTTFSNLNPKQKKWYFYWREQVLRGNYVDVDLSYIFLFVYELMNYSFNQKASLNVSMLDKLLENYSERHPKLRGYLEEWIADMLYELGEHDLAKEWSKDRSYTPPLYNQLYEREEGLQKISITSWKPYVKNYKETAFFNDNKNKIYRTFKESLPLLQKHYESKGLELIDRWFELKEERVVRNLFTSAVMGREHDQLHVHVKQIRPTTALSEDITTLFRLSENVTRLLNGEKREIKVEESVLPGGFKDSMLERFTQAAKTTNERFKVVQGKDGIEKGGVIPPAPKETPIARARINFDDSKIKDLTTETNSLIGAINAMSIDGEIEEVPKAIAATADAVVNDSNGTTNSAPPETSSANIFSSFGSEEGNEEDFVNALSEIEIEFLRQFEGGQYSQEDAKQFVKQKGIMIGMFLSELNEKANEHLGDNIVESQENDIVVYEEYELVITLAKER
jgi:TM2 domain-containing membrane protein YozV